MKIILDAMGGDHAPEAPVLGAIEAAQTYGSQITLVGRGEEILEVMKKHGIDTLPDGVEIANADDVVDMHDDPANVIRKKPSSSIWRRSAEITLERRMILLCRSGLRRSR